MSDSGTTYVTFPSDANNANASKSGIVVGKQLTVVMQKNCIAWGATVVAGDSAPTTGRIYPR